MLDLLAALDPARRLADGETRPPRKAGGESLERFPVHEREPALPSFKGDKDKLSRYAFAQFFTDREPERSASAVPEKEDKGADAVPVVQVSREAARLPLWLGAISAAPDPDKGRLQVAQEDRPLPQGARADNRSETPLIRAPAGRSFTNLIASEGLAPIAQAHQRPLGVVAELAEIELKPTGFESRDAKPILQHAKPPVLLSAAEPTAANLQKFATVHEQPAIQVFPLPDGAGADRAPLRLSSDSIAQTLPAVADGAKPAAPAAAQIASVIRTERAGANIEVRLEPAELGRVRIDFAVETADAVKAVLSAERGETLDHLRRHASQLADALKDAGFASVDLEFAERPGGGFGDNAPRTAEEIDAGSDVERSGRDVIYLSLRDDARLNLLV